MRQDHLNSNTYNSKTYLSDSRQTTPELLSGLGELLGGLSAASSAVCRAIDRPSESVENRSDMVGVVMRSDDDDRSLQYG